MTKRFLFAAAIFFLVVAVPSYAQRAIGVEWDIPSNPQTAQAELSQFQAWGITYLKIDEIPGNAVWKKIAGLDFKVYAMLPLRFPVSQTFSGNDSTLMHKVDGYLKHAAAQPSVKALGLFAYGALGDSKFAEQAADFSKYIKAKYDRPLYFQSARDSLATHLHIADFEMLAITGKQIPTRPFIRAYSYEPADSLRWKLAPVKYFLEHTPQSDSIPVFFHAGWLQKMVRQNPSFDSTLKLYTSSDNPVFPLPAPSESTRAHSFVIILLLCTWFIFAFTYYKSPLFKKAFIRYFTVHVFFVDDVMERHIRTLLPGFSILAQQAILGGICSYCVGHTFFSSLGQQALAAHYPIFAIAGLHIGFFLWGACITLLLEIICVFWLLFVNPPLTHLSQVLNLYPWTLQLNLFLGTLITLSYVTGRPAYLTLALASLFILLSRGAFIITAFDSTRRMPAKRSWYLLATAGLYVLLLFAFILWIANSQSLINVIRLAIALP